MKRIHNVSTRPYNKGSKAENNGSKGASATVKVVNGAVASSNRKD